MPVDSKDFELILRDIVEYLWLWEPEARRDFAFYALQQWEEGDKKKYERERRPALTFDRTRPIIDVVAGTEATNRFEPKFLPRESDLTEPDVVYSEDASKIHKWVRQRGDAEQQESAAFHSNIICGVGCTETIMDYERDPKGMIFTRRVPIFEIGWDPASKEPNMSDMRHVVRDRWVDKDELASLFGEDKVEEVITLAGSKLQGFSPDGFLGRLVTRITDSGYSAYADERGGRRYYDPKYKRIRLWECQYFERRYKTKVFLPDLSSGAPVGLALTEELIDKADAPQRIREYREMLEAANKLQVERGQPPLPGLEIIENFPSREYYRSWHVKGAVLKREVMDTGFTYNFMTCFEDWHEQDRRYFFGLMRPMRDPQRYANSFFSHAVHQWAANPKGALMFEEDLFENPEEAAEEWAKATGWLPVKSGSLSAVPKDKFVQLDSNVSFRGIESLLQHALSSVPQAAGVSESYFVGGNQDLKRTATTSIEAIQRQNLVTISKPFDSLRLYKRMQARLVLKFLKMMDPEQIIRVLGEKGRPFLEALNGDIDQEYDIVVEEVPHSQNRQMEIFEKLMETNFIPQLMEMGVPVPPAIAKFFPLPGDVNADFEKALTQAQGIMELQLQLQAAQTQLEMLQIQQMMMQGGMPPEGEGEVPPEEASVEGQVA
jgi:hypothetical protein